MAAPSAHPDPGSHPLPAGHGLRRQKMGWFRPLALTLAGLLAIFLIAFASLWWWTGTEGSLASAIRLAQQHALVPPQQLHAEGVTGSLRRGGHIDRLQWQQEGLEVTVNDATLAWQPLSVLSGTLKLQRLAAVSVTVNDQRPPSPPSAGPPENIRLPIRLTVDEFSLGSLRLTRPQSTEPLEIRGLAGRYAYEGSAHNLDVSNVEALGGRYNVKAVLTDSSPLQLDAVLSGGLGLSVPGTATATLPLTFQVTAQGPLTTLSVNAIVQTAVPAASPGLPSSMPPSAATPGASSATPSGTVTTPNSQPGASLSAVVTPWASHPLERADAVFDRLNVGALWPQAPHTLLNGTASARALDATNATGTSSLAAQNWTLQLQLVNTLPGPIDRKRLPVDEFQASAEWRDGVAIIQSLRALAAGGELTASGTWAPPTAAATGASPAGGRTPTGGALPSGAPVLPALPAASPSWKLQAALQNINPARLHTQLAPLPLGGEARAASRGDTIDFDANLKASTVAVPRSRNNPLAQLQLQSASATGNWNPALEGGTLALTAFNLRTDDAELGGRLQAQPAQPGGKGNVTLTAPGLNAVFDGEVREKTGGGSLNLRIGDAAAAMGWISKLPAFPAELQGQLRAASVNGNTELSARWQGGWQDPSLQARLSVPVLDLQMPAASLPPPVSASTTRSLPDLTSSTPTPDTLSKVTPAANVIRLRDVQAEVSGRLSNAQIGLSGRGEQGGRRMRLQLAGEAGQAEAVGKNASLAMASWQGVVRQLEANVVDPALSSGAWTLGLRKPVSLAWTPPQTQAGSASFQAGAGEAVLSAPTAQASSATISWQPVRWVNQQLTTAGRITGLPMAWAELVGGPQFSGSALSGNLVFDGAWDARLTDTLNVKASLARSSGDITVQAENAEGRTSRVAAGIRQASLSVTNEGEALNLALVWDSERAGRADGQLATRLTRTPATADAEAGWTWAPDAPLNGQLRAQLPRIGVWSVLAPPGWRIRGSIGTAIAITGTRAAPQLSGTLQADDLALRSVVDGIEFGNGRLRATLDGTRMRIDEFSLQGAARVGTEGRNTGAGGVLIAQGEAAWLNNQPSVRLNARIERLRGSIRTDRQITVSGALQATLEGKLATLTGALRVDQARLLLPEEGTPQLGTDVVVRGAAGKPDTDKGRTPASRQPSSPPDGLAIKVAVDLDMGGDFRVQGKGIDTQLRGALALSADSLTNPRLNGEIRTLGGQYRAYGQRLDVEQGIVRFTGQLDNPMLDILAIRPNLTQRVGVQIQGTALLPRVRLYAEPDLPDAEKLSWLVLGRSSASGGGEAALLQQAAVALLGAKGGSGGGIASRFGLDELSYGDATGGAGGSAVTLGKRFSNNFYAAYERSLSGAVGTLRIFYDLSQRFTVRAEAGEQSALDLIFTFQYD